MDFIFSSAFYVWQYHMPWCFWKIPLREWEWERQKVSKYYCENSFDPMDPWKYPQRFPVKESKTLSFKLFIYICILYVCYILIYVIILIIYTL